MFPDTPSQFLTTVVQVLSLHILKFGIPSPDILTCVAVVIPFIFERNGFEQHRAIFYKPIEVKKDIVDDEIIEYSQYISNIFETQIKKNPNDWFWQHRRFKECYKTLYDK